MQALLIPGAGLEEEETYTDRVLGEPDGSL